MKMKSLVLSDGVVITSDYIKSHETFVYGVLINYVGGDVVMFPWHKVERIVYVPNVE